MSNTVKVLALRTAGTNCNEETAFAFTKFGAEVDQVHINRVFDGEVKLKDYHILVISGGFSYGDDIAAGRILANELRIHLGEDLKRFVADGKLILGICNGFQVLTKAGLLPGIDLDKGNMEQTVTLTNNDSAKFEDRWTCLSVENEGPWLSGLPGRVLFPVAHGEGKFVPMDEDVLRLVKNKKCVAFRYCSPDGGIPDYPANPNGSVENIAGITDPAGRILGLMPHPERHLFRIQHPYWTRLENKGEFGDGAKIFENGIRYIQKKVLS